MAVRKIKNIQEISQAITEYNALIAWAEKNIVPHSRVRFKGSRSNRSCDQFREVWEMVSTVDHLHFVDDESNRYMTDALPSYAVRSKNASYKYALPFVGAENNIASLKEVEIDGVWCKTPNLGLVINHARPLVEVVKKPVDDLYNSQKYTKLYL